MNGIPSTYAGRADYAYNKTARRLFEMMESKKSNLAVAADLTNKDQLLQLAEKIGPKICVFKTHIDIVDDFDLLFIKKLEETAKKHHFLIFEDRKFADIGNTVEQQYRDGIFRIASWASITNAHVIPGPGIIEGLKKVGMPLGRGLLLLAEMSSKGSLATGEYTMEVVKMAKTHKDFVFGFVCQGKLVEDPGFIHFTPGVNLESKGDSLGQQYSTPEHVIRNKQTDIMIVGRGIVQSKNPEQEAEKYRDAGWKAYLERIHSNQTFVRALNVKKSALAN